MADALMVPAMYLLSGTLYEAPQRTHFWNNQKVNQTKTNQWLVRSQAVSVEADLTACEPMWYSLPRFHAPILGGWRKYVVLENLEADYRRFPWHLGWMVDGRVAGISRVSLRGHFVRALIGPRRTTFFALRSTGEQVTLTKAGTGIIGKQDKFSDVPLL